MTTYNDYLIHYKNYLKSNKKDENVARLAMQKVLGKNDANFYLFLNEKANEENIKKIQEILDRYVNGESYQYIVEEAYFYGLRFNVNKNVLIPRFDSEILVDEVIKNYNNVTSIIDLGTGSGCLAISIKRYLEDALVYASDISKKAIEVASKNAKENVTVVHFVLGDKLEPFIKQNIKVDLLVSNPPYIAENDEDISKEVRNNEPNIALFATNNGLAFYEDILKEARKVLNPKGSIIFEIGYKQASSVIHLAKKYLKAKFDYRIIKDLNGNDRVVAIDLLD